MGYSVRYVNIYVVTRMVYESIVGKSINGRARTREAVERSAATQPKKCHGGQESSASDFSFRDTSQDISRSEKQKQGQKAAASQELRPGPINTKQPSGNWKKH